MQGQSNQYTIVGHNLEQESTLLIKFVYSEAKDRSSPDHLTKADSPQAWDHVPHLVMRLWFQDA